MFDAAVADRFEEELRALRHRAPIFPLVRLVAFMPTNDAARAALLRIDKRLRELEAEHADIEQRAEAIYSTWADQPGFVPWRVGSNSLKQDEARHLARREIDATARTSHEHEGS